MISTVKIKFCSLKQILCLVISDMFSGPSTMVYSSSDITQQRYEDFDQGLEPYTYYEYSVSASNGAGTVRSYWAKQRSAQTAPTDVPAPAVVVSVFLL